MNIQFDIDSWLLKNSEKIRRKIVSGEISELDMLEEYPVTFGYDFDEDVFPILLQKENESCESDSLTSPDPYLEEAKRHGYSTLAEYPEIIGEEYVLVFEKGDLSFTMDEYSGKWYLFTSFYNGLGFDYEDERYELHLTPELLFDFLDGYMSLMESAANKWKDFYWSQEDCRRDVKQRELINEMTRRTLDEALGKKLIELDVPCNIYFYGGNLCLCVQIGKEDVAHGKISMENVSQVLSVIRNENIEYRKEMFEKMGYDLFAVDPNHTQSFAEYKSRINGFSRL